MHEFTEWHRSCNVYGGSRSCSALSSECVVDFNVCCVRKEKPLNILSFDDIRFTNICAAIQNEKEAKKSKSTKSIIKSGSWSASPQNGKQQHKKDWKRNDKKEDDNSQ